MNTRPSKLVYVNDDLPGVSRKRAGKAWAYYVDQCRVFGELLPLVRKRAEADLAGSNLSREHAIASVVRLLDLGVVRIGNEAYARANKSLAPPRCSRSTPK